MSFYSTCEGNELKTMWPTKIVFIYLCLHRLFFFISYDKNQRQSNATLEGYLYDLCWKIPSGPICILSCYQKHNSYSVYLYHGYRTSHGRSTWNNSSFRANKCLVYPVINLGVSLVCSALHLWYFILLLKTLFYDFMNC